MNVHDTISKIESETHPFYFLCFEDLPFFFLRIYKTGYLLMKFTRKNKGQGNNCFLTFFRPTNSENFLSKNTNNDKISTV